MIDGPRLRRRLLLASCGAALAGAGRAPSAPMLLVAGPGGGNLAAWANRLGPILADQLDAEGELQLRTVGGHDGVTGLNQFEAWAAPDGSAALLFPGEAALAGLAGDDRVRFQLADLLPLLAVTGPGVLMLRPRIAGPVRLASTTLTRPAIAGLLGLHLLGLPADIVPSGADETGAVLGGAADAVFLRGAGVPASAHALAQAGLRPLFAVSVPGCGRDPEFAETPSLEELLPQPTPGDAPLRAAWRAAATASLVQAMLVLPPLCPVGAVARWRRAARTAASQAPPNERLLGPETAPALLAGMVAPGAAQVALRDWLAAQRGGSVGVAETKFLRR